MSFEVVAIVIVVWVTISVVVALIVGAMIRLRDSRERPRELHSVRHRRSDEDPES